ncbi:hypothetical protein CBA19CS91_01720 [Paraburkholderia hospita]|nr:hypothetical protein CBA19CS91_01720 [Paraburkholderia hospita]
MSTHTMSHDDWEPDPGWPATAIPQRWVEALFAAMSATYGARFADLWRGTKIDQVKRNWGVELAKLSAAQMRAGRETLIDVERAPTLPEFIAHCRRARVEAAASEAPKLEEQMPLITPEQAEANRELLSRTLGRLQRSEPTCEWAFRGVLRGTTASGKPLPFNVARTATDAITSSAGRKVVEECADPELKAEYAAMRETIIDNYRMRGQPLWETP